MSYSEDFRTMVLSHLDAGETIEKVSQLFSVGTSSIKRWKRNRKVTGKVMGQGRPKNPYKIGDEDLKKYIKEHPDAYLNEIADYFGVTSPGVFATLKRLKITRKKRPFFTKKDVKKKRLAYLEKIANKNPEKMIYIDESGVDTFLVREYARDIRCEVVYWQDSGKRFARESFIAGLKNKHFISPFCYQGTMDTNLFNFWLVNFLLPNISVGDVIVMDNAAFDKSEKTKEIIEEASCELIFLPPYSPDLNPIEKYWASLKVKIKNNITRFKTLAESIDQAFKLDQLNFN